MLRHAVEALVATSIVGFARLVTGVRGVWKGCAPNYQQRVYFANHASHGDFVLLWSALPPALRHSTRPVAGSDYWLKSRLRRFIIQDVFRAVLIDRDFQHSGSANPVEVMLTALEYGDSLIIFPEGTRNTTEERLLPFKGGLYKLAEARPDVELVPVWIENLNRVMPKGEAVPIPLLCTVSFGEPIRLAESENRADFLNRAREALLALAPRLT
ncbi:lysophospholipid acyltransferase family protein [Parachitinimonas caeni]|uniref:Lysophospholipid acyltransferase family protein n=1 Tax=Parachitinimonas caeni TaxID=3031301 RepID=A0ABT7DU36_9NEIS|nr:lysophospholipid acyltransferase family protein [Parachitinimonas caeni]MDK2123551.1 lysophospholipid acyltransferase family protein [Parachitinimonas caeni]